MRSVCARCQVLKGEVPPLEDPSVTHGYCRECVLRAHACGGTITPDEREELLAILRDARDGMVTVTARIPAAAAEQLRLLCQVLEDQYAGVQRVDVAGLALTRELNAVQGMNVGTAEAIYRPLPISFFAPHVAELSRPVDGEVTDEVHVRFAGPVPMFGHNALAAAPHAPEKPEVEFFREGGFIPKKETPAQ